jgi:solute:Na+ symporter, SSS family
MKWLTLLLLCAMAAQAGEWPRVLHAFPGKTPKLDGTISPGEWDDATHFWGVQGWTAQFKPTTDPKDLSMHGAVKHDGKRLYFIFDVTDDVLYGIDTDRWLPPNNAKAHELTPEGFPWFGDEMEVLINAANKWTGNETAAGNGSSWQMVVNLTKSRLGGVGKGGLIEGEPRKNPKAWATYQKWIETKAMEAVAVPKPGGKGYIIEWAINFNPCLEVEPGVFYNSDLGNRAMGLNIALGDLDEFEKGEGYFGHFHHEDWFAGEKDTRTQLRQWGTLWMMAKPKDGPEQLDLEGKKKPLVPEPALRKQQAQAAKAKAQAKSKTRKKRTTSSRSRSKR